MIHYCRVVNSRQQNPPLVFRNRKHRGNPRATIFSPSRGLLIVCQRSILWPVLWFLLLFGLEISHAVILVSDSCRTTLLHAILSPRQVCTRLRFPKAYHNVVLGSEEANALSSNAGFDSLDQRRKVRTDATLLSESRFRLVKPLRWRPFASVGVYLNGLFSEIDRILGQVTACVTILRGF